MGSKSQLSALTMEKVFEEYEKGSWTLALCDKFGAEKKVSQHWRSTTWFCPDLGITVVDCCVHYSGTDPAVDVEELFGAAVEQVVDRKLFYSEPELHPEMTLRMAEEVMEATKPDEDREDGDGIEWAAPPNMALRMSEERGYNPAKSTLRRVANLDRSSDATRYGLRVTDEWKQCVEEARSIVTQEYERRKALAVLKGKGA